MQDRHSQKIKKEEITIDVPLPISESTADCKVPTDENLLENSKKKLNEEFSVEKKITLQHVKQRHQLPPLISLSSAINDKYEKVDIAYSQFHVAKTILANPNAIVLSEGRYEDLTPEVAKELESDPNSGLTEIKKIFPKGIPDRFSQLTETQKEILICHGGDDVLFYLGEITHVYKTTTKEKEKKLKSALKEMEKCALGDITKFDYNLFAQNEYQILVPREEEALFWVKQAALQSEKNHVLLIFGGGHHFEWYKDKLSKEGIEIQESIDTTLPNHTLPDPLDFALSSSIDTFSMEKYQTHNCYSSSNFSPLNSMSGTPASSFRMFGTNTFSPNFSSSEITPNSSNRKHFNGGF